MQRKLQKEITSCWPTKKVFTKEGASHKAEDIIRNQFFSFLSTNSSSDT